MANLEFSIGGRLVGPNHPPFVIAEMSGNHNQSLQRALEIVEAAAASGAHALKIQTYTADTMTLNLKQGSFLINDPKSLWYGRTLYDLYEEAHTPWDWHGPIFDRCRELGIICFSTPFDETAVDFLESLGAPAYKIASFENTDIPLVKKVAATGKPLIISTGMASVAELDETVKAAREAGARDIVLLKCTSTYPAEPLNTNIRTIPHLAELFGTHVGLSDHTMGVGAAVAAVSLGATVVEKHFTTSRAAGGVDSTFSLEPAEMQSLVVETKRAWQALGKVAYGCSPAEKNSLKFRRSLYVVENVKKGEKFTAKNLRNIRPGDGLPPRFIESFIGRTASRDLPKGTPASWDIVGP